MPVTDKELKPCGCDLYVPYIAGLDRFSLYCQKCGKRPDMSPRDIEKEKKYNLYDYASERFYSIGGEEGLRRNENAQCQ